MKEEIITGSIGTAISAVGTATSTTETLQIISLIITIIGGIITFLIVPLITWYKNSKKDGKIDKEEIKEGVNIIKNGVEQITKGKEKKSDEDNKTNSR